MFDFFLALFGGAALGGRLAYESAMRTASDRHCELYMENLNRLHNSSFHNQYRHVPKTDMVSLFEKEAGKDIVFVLGENWKKRVFSAAERNRGVTSYECAFMNPYDIAYEIWLSTHGCIDVIKTDYQIKTGGVEWTATSFIACQVINKNIRKFYPDVELDLVWNFMDLEESVRRGKLSGCRIAWNFELSDTNPRHIPLQDIPLGDFPTFEQIEWLMMPYGRPLKHR